MAFNGYLIRIGGQDEFFEHYMVCQTYKVSKKMLDYGSFRDSDGILKRTCLDHVSYIIQFDIKPCNNVKLAEFMGAIKSNFSIPKERKVSVTFYNAEDDNYITDDFYMPDPEFNIDHIDTKTNQIFFKQITIKFIGY